MSRQTKLCIVVGILLIMLGGLFVWHVTPRQIPPPPVIPGTIETLTVNQASISANQILANKIALYSWTMSGYVPATLQWQGWSGSLAQLFRQFGITQQSTSGDDGTGTGECALRGDLLYVRYEGGRCGIGYWFIRNTDGFEIRNETDFVHAIVPVHSVDAAIALVYGLTNDLAIDEGIPLMYVATSSDGYLIHVMNMNTFGCSTHEPFGQVFLVTPAGVVREVAREPEPTPDPNIPVVCVD